MIKSNRTLPAIIAILLLAFPGLGFASEVRDGQTHRIIVPLRNGAFVSFTTETVPDSSREPLSVLLEAEEKTNLVHRVFVDDKNDMFFGYDLIVEPAPASKRRFRVSVAPLSSEYERGLRARKDFRAMRPHPSFNAASFSASIKPQLVTDGDTLALDVLLNPRTGAKVVDLIKISADDPRLQEAPLSANAARDFQLEDVPLKVGNYKLLVNDELIYRAASGCAGAIIWFSHPARGRFVFSLTPHAGYDFRKVGTVEHNRIVFTWEGDRYEWVSSQPVVGSGGNWNLWVLHDPDHSPELFPHGAEPPSAGNKTSEGSDLERKYQDLERKLKEMSRRRQAELGTTPGSQDDSASPPTSGRIRVRIGAADRMQNVIPRN